jgi:hypothetical protein
VGVCGGGATGRGAEERGGGGAPAHVDADGVSPRGDGGGGHQWR